ncbi:hypothetical protein K933_17227 [Candidatus Halobonum tyrrellensis G22]|uniref:Three-Cys-motif partner protein TcmP n=2 Tax=Candidatus Halobonum TaxID=1431544 RepID=V4IUJ0_9EURY|nr:hypothetical protein K933_17227 [Candidatus Halobonum tyrrellensis G22]
MYTTVISEYFNDWFYIDALAGSGVSVYGDADESFLGSPLLAAKNAAEPFTKMYFIEQDKENAAALEKRLDVAFNGSDLQITPPECGYEVYVGDANKKLQQVTRNMWRVAKRDGKANFNHLTFIDNQGLNLNWGGLEDLEDSTTGDYLINFPTSNVLRASGHKGSENAMVDYYGGDRWRSANGKEELLEAYTTRLSGLGKTEQVVTNIDSGTKNYQYDMIYATRKTRGGSDYINAIEYINRFVEAVDGADVEDMLQILRGDQMTMESFLPKQDEDDPQSKLVEFHD